MLKEKENVISVQELELLRLVKDLLPSQQENLAERRELLRDWYLEWLDDDNNDLSRDEKAKAKNLFWQLDNLMKQAQPILQAVYPQPKP